jgi:hypothetical protein
MMRTKIQSFVSKYDLKMSIPKVSREYLGSLYDYAKNKFRNPAVKSLSRIF